MTTHVYFRAYLAGIFVPSLILPIMLAGFVLARLVFGVPFPIERAIVFPMALVPAGWGLWNMLWLATHQRTHLALGVHGAVAPLLLMPAGAITAHCLGILRLGSSSATWFHAVQVPYALIAVGLCCGVAAYYLVWKYLVGFLNRIVGIA